MPNAVTQTVDRSEALIPTGLPRGWERRGNVELKGLRGPKSDLFTSTVWEGPTESISAAKSELKAYLEQLRRDGLVEDFAINVGHSPQKPWEVLLAAGGEHNKALALDLVDATHPNVVGDRLMLAKAKKRSKSKAAAAQASPHTSAIGAPSGAQPIGGSRGRADALLSMGTSMGRIAHASAPGRPSSSAAASSARPRPATSSGFSGGSPAAHAPPPRTRGSEPRRARGGGGPAPWGAGGGAHGSGGVHGGAWVEGGWAEGRASLSSSRPVATPIISPTIRHVGRHDYLPVDSSASALKGVAKLRGPLAKPPRAPETHAETVAGGSPSGRGWHDDEEEHEEFTPYDTSYEIQ